MPEDSPDSVSPATRKNFAITLSGVCSLALALDILPAAAVRHGIPAAAVVIPLVLLAAFGVAYLVTLVYRERKA